jgi:D-tyrosyl-tRNA(Tyr) deacylase
VAGEQISSIGTGLLVLIGVGQGDGESDAQQLAERCVHLRIFEDEAGRMNRSLLDVGGALLAVSQFTLYGDARRGRRPSFIEAMEPEGARRLYETFCDACRALGVEVQKGVFRADMKVELVNDGPVTIMLDSNKRF